MTPREHKITIVKGANEDIVVVPVGVWTNSSTTVITCGDGVAWVKDFCQPTPIVLINPRRDPHEITQELSWEELSIF